jgi:hypothetical protein
MIAEAHEAPGQRRMAAKGGEQVRSRTALDVGAKRLIKVL